MSSRRQEPSPEKNALAQFCRWRLPASTLVCKLKIIKRRRCQSGLGSASIGGLCDSLQSLARNPGSATFIADDRAPTSGAHLLTLNISATANRSGSRNHHQPSLAAGGAIQRN